MVANARLRFFVRRAIIDAGELLAEADRASGQERGSGDRSLMGRHHRCPAKRVVNAIGEMPKPRFTDKADRSRLIIAVLSSERHRANTPIRQLNFESQAAVTDVKSSHGRFEFRKCTDRHRRIADGQDTHPGTQAELEGRAARDHSIDLDDGLGPLLFIGGALAEAQTQRKEQFRRLGKLGDRYRRRLRLAIAVERNGNLGPSVKACGHYAAEPRNP